MNTDRPEDAGMLQEGDAKITVPSDQTPENPAKAKRKRKAQEVELPLPGAALLTVPQTGVMICTPELTLRKWIDKKMIAPNFLRRAGRKVWFVRKPIEAFLRGEIELLVPRKGRHHAKRPAA